MKAFLKVFATLCISGLGILATPIGQAQETVQKNPLKVPFATGEYPPYSSEAMPEYGATTELVSAVCKAAGIQPVFTFFPWKRVEINLVSGTVFGAFPYSKNPERNLHFDFSDDLYSVTNAMVYFDGNPKTRSLSGNEKLSDLKDFSFGIIAGSFAEPRLKDLGMAYVPVTAVDQLVKMLSFKRIDFYIDDEATIFSAVHRLFPADAPHFRALNFPFEESKSNNVMVSRSYPNSAEILMKFNAGLAKIKKTGEYDRILAKHHLRKP